MFGCFFFFKTACTKEMHILGTKSGLFYYQVVNNPLHYKIRMHRNNSAINMDLNCVSVTIFDA